MAVARLALNTFADGDVRLSDEVELYQRTYTTLLRSSGETQLRVLERSHMAMGSSLHPLAASEELDLGAFLYAIRRLPAGIVRARRICSSVTAIISGERCDSIFASDAANSPCSARRAFSSSRFSKRKGGSTATASFSATAVATN